MGQQVNPEVEGGPELYKLRARCETVAKHVISAYYLPNIHHLIQCQRALPPLRLATPPLSCLCRR